MTWTVGVKRQSSDRLFGDCHDSGYIAGLFLAAIPMFEYFTYQLSPVDLVILATTALLVGSAKAGLSGSHIVAVPLLAIAFGGRDSTGVMLPILITADILAVAYYSRHANWFHLARIFPWAALGVLLGTLLGDWINDESFRQVMGVIIFLSLALMIWQELKKSAFAPPTGHWFAMLLGVTSGFTTMVGNLAGTVTALYLLAMRLPKNVFIGTAAWFFLSINLFKVPFHVYAWETINWNSFAVSLLAVPAVAIGFFIGKSVVKLLSEHVYRWVIIVSTAVASITMMF